jgi:V/A-type H+-transporting ATPase subunit I
MITQMKKVTLFISEIEADADLTVLGQLGVMHINPYKPPKDESIDRLQARIVQMKKAISILKRYANIPLMGYEQKTDRFFSSAHKGKISLMQEVLETEEKRLQKTELLNELKHYKQWYKDWGTVSKHDIKILEENGFFIKLYLLDDVALEKISNCRDILVLGKLNKMNQVVYFADHADAKLEHDQIEIPKYRFKALENSIKQTEEKVETANKHLSKLTQQDRLTARCP